MGIAHRNAHAGACQALSVLQVHRHRQQASPVNSTYTTQAVWLACEGEAGPPPLHRQNCSRSAGLSAYLLLSVYRLKPRRTSVKGHAAGGLREARLLDGRFFPGGQRTTQRATIGEPRPGQTAGRTPATYESRADPHARAKRRPTYATYAAFVARD